MRTANKVIDLVEFKYGQAIALDKRVVGSQRELADKLADLHENENQTQTQIAEKMGHSQSWVSDLLTWRANGFPADRPSAVAKRASRERLENIRQSNNPTPAPDELTQTPTPKDKHFLTNGTGDNDWFTPPKWLVAARQVLGKIDICPASPDPPVADVQADKVFTVTDDGLKHEWRGRVWLNPPFSRDLIGPFVAKLLEEFAAGRTTEAIMLTHSYTSSEWWQLAGTGASAICFPSERVKFYGHDRPDKIGEDGKPIRQKRITIGDTTYVVSEPTQGQTFFYFGKRAEKFKQVFAPLGVVK